MQGVPSLDSPEIPKDVGQFGVNRSLSGAYQERSSNPQARETRTIMAKIALNLSGAELASLIKILKAQEKQTATVTKLTEKLEAAVPAAA